MENRSHKPRLILARAGERRKTTYLNGPPFIDDRGLVLIDRRASRDRRGQEAPPAVDSEDFVFSLLQFPARDIRKE